MLSTRVIHQITDVVSNILQYVVVSCIKPQTNLFIEWIIVLTNYDRDKYVLSKNLFELT